MFNINQKLIIEYQRMIKPLQLLMWLFIIYGKFQVDSTRNSRDSRDTRDQMNEVGSSVALSAPQTSYNASSQPHLNNQAESLKKPTSLTDPIYWIPHVVFRPKELTCQCTGWGESKCGPNCRAGRGATLFMNKKFNVCISESQMMMGELLTSWAGRNSSPALIRCISPLGNTYPYPYAEVCGSV